MKLIFSIILCLSTVMVSCKNKAQLNSSEKSNEHRDDHEVALQKLQTAQQNFKSVIEEIKDTKSYDAAVPRLNQIITDMEEVVEILQTLDPPESEFKKHILSEIMKGNKRTEPIAGDLHRFILTENREDHVTAWLESFQSVFRKVGIEFGRLYYEKANTEDVQPVNK